MIRSLSNVKLSRRARRAFTLIEILVVIAIIVILVGTVVAIGTGVRSSAQIKQTKQTLKSLQAILQVYKDEVGAEPANNTTDFVSKFNAYPPCKKAMNNLPTGVVTSSNVLDGFGSAITFVPTSGNVPGYFFSSGPNGTAGDADDIRSTDP